MGASGETVQEVKFWLELENELAHIDAQLKSPEAGTHMHKHKDIGSHRTH